MMAGLLSDICPWVPSAFAWGSVCYHHLILGVGRHGLLTLQEDQQQTIF